MVMQYKANLEVNIYQHTGNETIFTVTIFNRLHQMVHSRTNKYMKKHKGAAKSTANYKVRATEYHK
jgi:hypothetical protein